MHAPTVYLCFFKFEVKVDANNLSVINFESSITWELSTNIFIQVEEKPKTDFCHVSTFTFRIYL